MAKNKTEESNQGFQNKGKKLIICMIAALFLCPVICDREHIRIHHDISLPANSMWYAKSNPDHIHRRLALTYDGGKWVFFSIIFSSGRTIDMGLQIKKDELYDIDNKYSGYIVKKDNGDIVIHSDVDELDGVYIYEK